MKFKILVSNNKEKWWEEYDKNVSDAKKMAKQMVENFNSTLRPGEKPRTLLSVEIFDKSNEKHHQWEKDLTGMSVMFRGSVIDRMYCKGCGITGKRYGFSSGVIIDSKYRKKVYRDCSTSKIQMRNAKR